MCAEASHWGICSDHNFILPILRFAALHRTLGQLCFWRTKPLEVSKNKVFSIKSYEVMLSSTFTSWGIYATVHPLTFFWISSVLGAASVLTDRVSQTRYQACQGTRYTEASHTFTLKAPKSFSFSTMFEKRKLFYPLDFLLAHVISTVASGKPQLTGSVVLVVKDELRNGAEQVLLCQVERALARFCLPDLVMFHSWILFPVRPRGQITPKCWNLEKHQRCQFRFIWYTWVVSRRVEWVLSSSVGI